MGVGEGVSTGRPHSRQNLALRGSSAPQAVQRSPNDAPHSRQNLARSGFSAVHLGQRIADRYDSCSSKRLLRQMGRVVADWSLAPGVLEAAAGASHVRNSALVYHAQGNSR